MVRNRGLTFVGVAALIVSACTQRAAQTPLLPQTDGVSAARAAYSHDASVPTVRFKEFALPPAYSGPTQITRAPGKQQKLWFSEHKGDALGVITTSGRILEYPLLVRAPDAAELRRGPTPMVTLPPKGNAPYGIAVGGDNRIWFGEEGMRDNKIGRVVKSKVTQYRVTAPCCLQNLVLGPDGALWFPIADYFDGLCQYPSDIGRITTRGSVTLYPLGTASCPANVTVGPNKNLWFTQAEPDGVAELATASGKKKRTFKLPVGSRPIDITLGPDKALWFTECTASTIGRITVSGKLHQYKLRRDAFPVGITAGPDHALWFTEAGGNALGRITTNGTITEYSIPTKHSKPFYITVGPDGALWFTEYRAGKIGRAQISK
jgi:virginiamycin B lyase